MSRLGKIDKRKTVINENSKINREMAGRNGGKGRIGEGEYE